MARGSNEANLGTTGYELLGALQQPGCPICTFVKRGTERYLDRISYDQVNDLTVRDELRKAIGYCAVHGQEWLRLHNTLGTAIIYYDVITNVRRAMAPFLNENSGPARFLPRLRGNNPGNALADALEPTATCPACRQVDRLTDEATRAFAPSLANPDFLAAFRAHATGICLPHLRQTLRHAAEAAHVALLLEIQEAKLAAACADMAEVIRKNDYRFKHEEKGPEFEAPARAVEQAAGRLSTQLNPPKK